MIDHVIGLVMIGHVIVHVIVHVIGHVIVHVMIGHIHVIDRYCIDRETWKFFIGLFLKQWRRKPKKSGGSEPYFFAGEQ